VWPVAIGVFALALRLYGLGDKPFWMDEIATLHRATSSVPDLVASSLANNHYPSYFLMLWLVAHIGTSQWMLRLPSAIFGAIAAALATATGRRVAGARSGIVAGLLMTLSPFEVQFGQEARSYTLVSCLILVALWGLVRLAQEPRMAAAPFRGVGARRGAWLAFGLGTAAALNVLNVAVPWLVAANLGAIAIGRAAGDKQRAFWRNWGWVQLAILASWLPMVIAIYVVGGGTVLDGPNWVPPASPEAIWSVAAPVYLLRIANFITLDPAPAVIPGLSLAVAALVAFGIWRLRRSPPVLTVLGSAALVLPLTLCLVSLFVPLLVPRYFAWSAAPFFIIVGSGLGWFSGRRFAAVAVPFAAVCLLNLLPYYHYETKPRWDLVASDLAAVAQPGDEVLVNGYYGYWVLSAFTARAGFDSDRVKLTWQEPDKPPPSAPPPGHALWVVYGRTGQAAWDPIDDFKHSLAALGQPVSETPVGRYIVMWRYAEPQTGYSSSESGGGCGNEKPAAGTGSEQNCDSP